MHTVQVTFTNSQSGGVPITSSQAQLQGDASPTNLTFNTDGTGWQLNNNGAGSVPYITGNVLELTDNGGNEASSAFYTLAQYVGNFTASFTYTPTGDADGACFVVQNSPAGDTALGGEGGGLFAPPHGLIQQRLADRVQPTHVQVVIVGDKRRRLPLLHRLSHRRPVPPG